MRLFSDRRGAGGAGKKLILQGKSDFYLAHLALQKLHILPSAVANMTKEEKAFLAASFSVMAEENKKQRKR